MNREAYLLMFLGKQGLHLRPMEQRTVPGRIAFNRAVLPLYVNKSFRRARRLSEQTMMQDVYADMWRSERKFAAQMASLHQAMIPVLEAATPFVHALVEMRLLGPEDASTS